MSYLHCHNCEWGQDDFWSDNYSPFKGSHINALHNDLMSDDLDKPIYPGYDCVSLGLPRSTTLRQLVIRELESKIRVIRSMAVPRHEDFNKVTFTCPVCGSKNWDID